MRPEAQTRMGEPGNWPPLKDKRLFAFLRHWAERRDGMYAARERIDPVALRHLLPHVWIYRWQAEDGAFVCTLAGEAVSEAWGHGLIGKRLQEFARPEDAQVIEARYRDVLEMPAIQYSRRSVSPPGQAQRAAERLIVPLSDAGGRPYGVFGISLYRFDPVVAIDKPVLVNLDAVVYPCIGLPAELPDCPK